LLIFRGKKIEYFKVSLIDVSSVLFCRRTRFMEHSVRGRDGDPIVACVKGSCTQNLQVVPKTDEAAKSM